MKINTLELVALLAEGKVQFIDIRFPEEYSAWHMGFGKNIPLHELPSRLSELDKTMLIVTACPHKDRAAMARMFLTVKGFKARYLKDGLLGLAEFLRGDKAKGLMEAMSRPPEVVTSKNHKTGDLAASSLSSW
jgi:rhodanese-related sulfurtransferase